MVGKQINRMIFALGFMAGICLAEESKYTKDRYDVIVDRSPFGADPLVMGESELSEKNATEASKAAEKELRLCFLLESQEGEIRAGFENKTAKPGDPKNVMLMVGESFRGMKLLNIDLINSSATLDRRGSKVTFELTKGVASASARKAPGQSTRRFGGGFRRQPTKAPAKPAAPALSPDEQSKKRKEIRDDLRQYQMEVIRAGMPPLPIPLTQEMDDQLVTEGILAPGE